MSTRRDRKKLRTFFEQGDRPDESQFSDLIESGFNQIDDDVHAVDQKIGIGTDQPDEKLDVDGKVKVREDLSIKGHIVGDKADKNPNEDTLYLANYAAIGLHGENKPAQAGDLTLSANKASGASGKIVLNRFLGTGQGHAPGMIIDGDGKVGIGNDTPDADFQVGGNHVSASLGEAAGASTGWGTSYLGFNAARKNNQWQIKSDSANNGGAVVFGNIFGGLNFATIPTQGSSSAQNVSDQQMNSLTKMKIAPNGNVGIGLSGTPDNKLHIDNGVGKGANTGLKLSSGAGDKKILVSDSAGNASWREADFITNGLWKESGNDIANGNSGNVGIGLNNPDEKLKVNGNIQLSGNIIGKDNSQGKLDIYAAKTNGGAYMHMFGADQGGNNEGGITFVASGKGSKNGFGFLHHNRQQGNNGNQQTWDYSLKIDGFGNSSYQNHHIYFRNQGDKNHGLAYFGDGINYPFDGSLIDGPVLFGNGGGALGSVNNAHQVPFDQATKKVAMKWKNDQSVDFQGEVKVKGYKPIWVRNYFFKLSDKLHSGAYLRDSGGGLIKNSKYGVAIVSGFKSSAAKLAPETANLTGSNPDFKIEAFTYLDSNGNWMIRADFASHQKKSFGNIVHDHEEWDVTITFIAKELVRYDGNTSNSN
ncbi:MAG: hypothetical protein AAFQ94_16945 [Bacteroidota bacterium]